MCDINCFFSSQLGNPLKPQMNKWSSSRKLLIILSKLLSTSLTPATKRVSSVQNSFCFRHWTFLVANPACLWHIEVREIPEPWKKLNDNTIYKSGLKNYLFLTANCLDFISHDACQQHLNSIWYGMMSPQTGLMSIILMCWLPFLLPVLANQRLEEKGLKPITDFTNGCLDSFFRCDAIYLSSLSYLQLTI